MALSYFYFSLFFFFFFLLFPPPTIGDAIEDWCRIIIKFPVGIISSYFVRHHRLQSERFFNERSAFHQYSNYAKKFDLKANSN